MDIGSALKKIREKKGMTQEAAAKLMGLAQGALSKLERAGSEPEISTLKKVAKGYDIPIEVIMFMSLNEGDIPEKRREFYNQLGPLVQTIIDERILTTTI